VGDRGLAGSYNSGVLRADRAPGGRAQLQRRRRDVVDRGQEGAALLPLPGIDTEGSFAGIADRPNFDDAREVANVVTAPFVAGEMDLVQLVSTRFISAGTQRVEVLQMLPLPLPSDGDPAEDGIDTPPSSRAVGTPSSNPSPRNC